MIDPEVKAAAKAMALSGERNAEITAVTGVIQRTLCRWRKEWGIPSPEWSNRREVECGTYPSYEQGCRCEGCRDANRIRGTRQNRKRYQRVKESGLPAHIPHGASAYVNWGCRCEVCSAAHHVKMAANYAKRKAS